ncbi:MAG: GNAT family N-acetyltransferase [Acidobacteriota bacterium]|nr:GNAT family N-acetyltransferase [Acidobacteriota bacterium]
MEENSNIDPIKGDGGLIIRSALEADASTIKAVERACGLSEWRESAYKTIAGNDSGILLIAAFPSGIAGFCHTRLITKPKQPPFEKMTFLDPKTNRQEPKDSFETVQAELCNLGILKVFRRNGAGTGLLRETIRRLAEFSSFSLFLEVRRSNSTAIGFYDGFGFKKSGIRPGYYRKPREDAMVMEFRRWNQRF